MGSLSPVAIAAGIVLLVAVAGIFITLVQRGSTFKGYEEVAGDAARIATAIKGETFRDGNDLVISGNYAKLPTQVRFSYDERTPGLNIRMSAPSTFTYSAVPRGADQAGEGRVTMRTGDNVFDAKFNSRTDHPTQAKMLVGGRIAMGHIQKLCCSSRTFLGITPGSMELSELVIPTPYTSKHVIEHLASLGSLAKSLEEMPGAEDIKIQPMQHERSSWGLRAAVAIGAIAAVITVYSALHPAPQKLIANDADATSSGVWPADAKLIPKLDKWRLATPEDADAMASGWLRANGKEANGRIEGDFTGNGSHDVAYLLVRPESRRLVILSQDENAYDTQFEQLAAVALIPKRAISSVEWAAKPTEPPDGDGLVLVRNSQQFDSAIILYLHDKRIVSGTVDNYQQLNLR